MGYKHQFSSGESFVIPPPPGAQPAVSAEPQMPPTVLTIQNQAKVIEPNSPAGIIHAEILRKSYAQVYDIAVFRCACQRCFKEWVTFQTTPPKSCPGCKSAWWQLPPRPETRIKQAAKAAAEAAKLTKKKPVKGGKRGRPRKYAVEGIPADGAPRVPSDWPEEIPEIPVELLGALGEPEVTSVEDSGSSKIGIEEDFPVPTPFSHPAVIPITSPSLPDPQEQAGQSAYVGGSPSPTDPPDDVIPPPAMDPTFEEDDWDRFGP